MAPDLGSSGKFQQLYAQRGHTDTSRRIPLSSLEQMKAIDLGGPLRVVVEDFTYGIDELLVPGCRHRRSLGGAGRWHRRRR